MPFRRDVFAHFIGVSDNGLAALSPTAWIFLRQRKLMGMDDDTVSTWLDLSLSSFLSLLSLSGFLFSSLSVSASLSMASLQEQLRLQALPPSSVSHFPSALGSPW
jgi:uncharacterized membrane protein